MGQCLVAVRLSETCITSPSCPTLRDWTFAESGPLSGANGALPWIVFERDRGAFLDEFPQWRIESIRPGMPLRYLLSGGVSLRSFMPGWTFTAWRGLEAALEPWMRSLAMFATIVMRRTSDASVTSDPRLSGDGSREWIRVTASHPFGRAQGELLRLIGEYLSLAPLLFGASWGIRETHAVSGPGIEPSEGFKYSVLVPVSAFEPFFHLEGDGVRHPRRADTHVYKDGRQLGPAHRPHDFIRADGRGQFSHWGSTLYS